MNLVQVEICMGMLILTCGQVLWWLRRDNVLGYLQGGFFLSTFLLPVFGTAILQRHGEETLRLYATLLLLGGAFYIAGLVFGAPLGNRPPGRSSLVFWKRLNPGTLLNALTRRARALALLGLVSLVLGYAAIGYVPFLSPNPVAAKYGVGIYEAGFRRGAIPYRFALNLAGTVLPLILIVWYRRRRWLDLILGLLLAGGLFLSLSRVLAFSGLLLAAAAIAAERRIRPVLIVGIVTGAFIVGAVSNEIFFPETASRGSLATRIAANAPDLDDQLRFLRGFELWGERRSVLSIFSGIGISRTESDPSNFALRTMSGTTNVHIIPSGGLRLPAPVWGYVSLGFFGAAAWSFLAGVFSGWGTVRLKRLLENVQGKPGSSLNLILAAIFYSGTFGVLSNFYFATTSMLLQLLIALYVGYGPRTPFRSSRQVDAPTRESALPTGVIAESSNRS